MAAQMKGHANLRRTRKPAPPKRIRPLRSDVTRAQVLAVTGKHWTLCAHREDDRYDLYATRRLPMGLPNIDKPIPPEQIVVRIIPSESFSECGGVTFDTLWKLAQLFDTDNINVVTSFEADYSDLTPGAGAEIEIVIRPAGVTK